MKEHRQEKPEMRMIHVRIPEELHKRLRIRAAEKVDRRTGVRWQRLFLNMLVATMLAS